VDVTEVRAVFEREYERMTTWVGMWVGTDKAAGGTDQAFSTTLSYAAKGSITTHGPLQLLYRNGPTSSVLCAAADGRTGPKNGMKNWVCPTVPEIHQLCQVYVAIGYAYSMVQTPADLQLHLRDHLRLAYGPTSDQQYGYRDRRMDGQLVRELSKLRRGLAVLGDSTPAWGYAMGRLWQHEVDRTLLWLQDVETKARHL